MKNGIETLCKKHQLTATLTRGTLTLNTASPATWGMVDQWGWNAKNEWAPLGKQRKAIIHMETNVALAELRASKGKSGELLKDLTALFGQVKFVGGMADMSATFRVS